MKHFLLLNVIILLFSYTPLIGKQNITQQQSLILRGRVIANDTQSALNNASVTIEGENTSSVTNQDGYFVLRVPESARNSNVIIRYLGYNNISIPVITLIGKENNNIIMTPSSVQLGELYVVSGDGKNIVLDALKLVPQNYSTDPNMMVAFYRESIKKNSSYISLVEAVLDVYKSSYSKSDNDLAKIYIGRKATNISPRDTLLLKFQGGISDALMLDIVKHPEIVFGENGDEYQFNINGIININNKPHYAIYFEPLTSIEEILFRGTLYIDIESLAISRAEFKMNVENRKDASKLFIRRKPAKMRIDVAEASYVANYIEKDNKWYFNYSSTDITFNIRWTNRFFGLFRTNFNVSSEMAITDRYNTDIVKFPRKDRIRSSDIIAEKVEHFQDPEFWGDYNIIEPEIEISKAINKLSNKLMRRDH